MSGLSRMLNRILIWFNILRRVRGIGLRMQVGLLFSSLVDSLMILVEPALARLPMIYVEGTIYSPKYKAYFRVRRFSDDLYSIMPDREGDVNEKILECLAKGSLFVDVGASIGYYSVVAAKLVGKFRYSYHGRSLTSSKLDMLTTSVDGWDRFSFRTLEITSIIRC